MNKQQIKNRMHLNITFIVIGLCLIYLIVNVALPPLVAMYNESSMVKAQTEAIVAEAQLKRDAAANERAEAQLKVAQAAQIQQQIRFNDEHNDGTALNVQARIDRGEGITAYEQQQTDVQRGETIKNILIVVGIVVLLLIIISRL